MKLTHRISSFLLALVLLFGCVSTSVFATDSAANEEEQSNETAHTHDYSDPTIDLDGDKLCDACVAEQLDANKSGIIHPDNLKNYINDTGKPNSEDPSSDRVTATAITETSPYGFSGFSDGNSSKRHILETEENGNKYISIMGSKDSGHRAVYTSSNTRYASADNFIKRFAERTQKSFVVTTDVKLHSKLSTSLPLITLTSYMKNNVAGNPTTSTDIKPLQSEIVKASKDGKIQYRDGGSWKTIEDEDKNLIGEDFNTISIHVRPEAGDFGLYDLYFGGELVKKDIQFLTETENNLSTWTYEGTEASGYDYHLKNRQEVKGAKDYLIGLVYLGIYQSSINVIADSGNADDVILSIDNTKVYFSEDYIEGNHNFKIVGNHSHDLSTNEIVETFACHCGKELEVRLPLDTVTEGVCDTCGLTVKGSGIIHPDNLKNYINDTGKPNSEDPSSDRVTATAITETSPYGFSGFSDANSSKRHILVTEENGNNYISIMGSKDTGHVAVYTSSNTRYASSDNFIKRFAERTQKSFVVTTDVKLHSKLSTSLPLITLTSYMKNNVAGNPTTSTDIKPLQSEIVKASKDGKIQYRDGGSWKTIEDEDKNLIVEDFNTISIHVRPEAGDFGLYDLYFDGELVKKDIKFLTETENNSSTWTYEGTEASGYDYHLKNGQTVNGAKDYLIGLVYLGIYSKNINVIADSGNADDVILSIDNTKVYFSEDYIECASHQFETVKHEHDYKTGELVDTLKCHCGATEEMRLPFDRNGDNLCDECKEQVAGDITVVARQVWLDELIGLKLYVYIGNEEWINDNNKAIFTVGDNLKTEVIPLSKAVKTDGLYEFDIKLTSIQMAEKVTLGFEIDGETENVYTTSVKDYAEALITDENQTEKTRVLAKALLNYGAAAQEYFVGRNGNPETLADYLANAGLSEADKTVATLTANDLADYEFKAGTSTNNVRFTGATLIFSSKTSMKVYFTASDNATVTVGGKAYAKVQDGEEYYVTITAATPADAMTPFEFVITDGDTVVESNISVFTAVHAALSNLSGDTKLVNLVTAYARYCEPASSYVANK